MQSAGHTIADGQGQRLGAATGAATGAVRRQVPGTCQRTARSRKNGLPSDRCQAPARHLSPPFDLIAPKAVRSPLAVGEGV